MKKILILLFLLVSASPVFAAEWREIFEKKYIDMSSIERSGDVITFWTKFLRKDAKEVFPINNKPYWYTISRWNIDCANKKARINVITVYDLKGDLMYSDEYNSEWNTIIPDTYADGFYRLFCLLPYEDNPLLK
jgi:hypothetical protein